MTRPGRLPVYRELPDLVNGFEQDRYEIKLVKPYAATNLFTNPSFEANLTGLTAISLASGFAFAQPGRRGNRGAIAFPSATTNAGCYMTANLTSGVTYFFSLDVWVAAGMRMRLVVASSPLGTTYEGTSKFFTGNSRWERPFTVFTAPATATYSFIVQKDPAAASARTDYFVTDGWQVERDRLTTYLDGSMRGFVRNQIAYTWSGAEHASTSSRIANTRSGGEEILLSDYGFRVTAILGLGGDGFANQSVENAFLGGATYERSVQTVSRFDLVGAFYGGLSEIMRNKSDLRSLLKYDAGVVHQPLVMKIRVKDDCGNYISEPMEVRCLYSGGLAGVRDNYNQERTALSFEINDPYTGYLDGDIGITVPYEENVTAAYHIANINGQWAALGSGFNDNVLAIAVDSVRGRVYFVGEFTTAGGATHNRVCYWDTATQAFVAMDGGANNAVTAIRIAANGDVWIVGAFSTIGTGAATTRGVARWNIATGTWTAFNISVGSFVVNNAVEIDDEGLIYVGGRFTDWDLDGDSDYIVCYNGANWIPLSTGIVNNVSGVLALAYSNGLLYVGGDFTSAGGVSGTTNGAIWDTYNLTWHSIGAGVLGGDVYTLLPLPDGRIVMGGDFTSVDTTGVNNVGIWSGGLSGFFYAIGAGVNGIVLSLTLLPDGGILLGGGFTEASGLATADRVAIWTGTGFVPLDVSLPGTPNVYAGATYNNDIYLGFDTTGTAVASGLVTVTNPGSADAYPVIIITGPGQLHDLVNQTTGDVIYFDLTLLAGEVATLDLTRNRVKFSSNFRANLLGSIVRGSSYNFRLAAGANTIRFQITGDTSETGAVMVYRPVYGSLDDILYRP